MLFREATFVLCLREGDSEANRGPDRNRVAWLRVGQSGWMSCCAVASVLRECHRNRGLTNRCVDDQATDKIASTVST